MTYRILIVENDGDTDICVPESLTDQGHHVSQSGTGPDGLACALSQPFDLVIVDRMAPGLDGLSIVRAIRATNSTIPVLMISALASVADRIQGLEAGSDDYLIKPFSLGELLARVNALLRSHQVNAIDKQTLISVGDLNINRVARTVTRDGKTISVKPREYLLLEYLAQNQGHTVSRMTLLQQVWHCHFDPGTNVIDVHVSRLRRTLEHGFDKPILHTIKGVGYMLSAA